MAPGNLLLAAPPAKRPDLRPLINALDTPDSTRWNNAIEALWKTATKRDLAALLAATNDPRPRVRAGALLAIGCKFARQHPAPEPPYVPPHIIRCLKDSDAEVRWAAASMAHGFVSDSPELVAALLKALDDTGRERQKRYMNVAQSAAMSLGFAGQAGKLVYEALMRGAEKGDEVMRNCAFQSLGRLAAKDPGQQAMVLKFLIRQIGSQPEKSRHYPMIALIPLGRGAKPAIPALREAFKLKGLKGEWSVRAQIQANVLAVLKAIGPEAAIALPDFLPVLRDKKVHVTIRRAIIEFVEALGKKGKPALPVLKAIAADANEVSGMPMQAAEAIQKLAAAE
jgi:HEAT repeat protein